MDEETEATLTLNESSNLYRLEGKDSFGVKLNDGENFISLEYVDDGITFFVSKDIFVDKMAPVLNLNEDLDNKQFKSEDLIITGTTEATATVTINSQKVAVNENGEFSHTVKLKKGENAIEIKASDVAGNGASKTLTVFYGSKGSDDEKTDGEKTGVESYLPLIIALIVSVVAIVLAIFLMKRNVNEKFYRKDLAFKINVLNLISYLTIILAAISLVVAVFNGINYIRVSQTIAGEEFLSIAETSIDRAYDYINNTDSSFITMIVSGILTVVFAVASIVLRIIYKKKSK